MPYPKQKAPKGRSSTSSEFSNTDPRFASLESDPRFRLPSKKHTHTKLDKRFARVLKDDDFSEKASVDRYGRKVEKGAGRKELERLYSLEDDEESEGDDDEDIVKELKRAGKGYDPAREGGFSESSSEEEDVEEDGEDEEIDVEGLEEAEILVDEGNAVPMGELSSRLAAVNLDWDNVRAVDLMAVATSFAPPEGRIISVTVYPSEFGRERMEREEIEGPPREIFSKGNIQALSDEEEDSEDEDERIKKDMLQEDKGEEFDSTALRNYQIDRLRYYYAIIHCSSPAVAKQLYDDMDGREYLSSANFFDLRFVPDEVTFDDKPRDVCDSTPQDYKPTEFVTDALTHSKVKLTWDAEDMKRKEVQKRAFSRREIDENDLQAYIGSASSSSAEESEEGPFGPFEEKDDDVVSITSKSTVNKQDRRDALRAALGLGSEPSTEKRRKKGDKGPVGDMLISFTPGLSASNDNATSVFENDPRDIEETTLEKYVRRERERKQRRKERHKAKREGRDFSEEEAGAGAEGKDVEENGDQGFDDPFFTDPMLAEKESKKARKAEKTRIRAEREKEEKLSESQRAELELLLAGDGDEDNVRHFDMREIQKREKNKVKKGKKKKALDLDEQGKEQELFKVDVKDERFSRLFDDHEFAIDPTNPRFRNTEGMKAFMDEGRKKRAKSGEENGERKGKRRREIDESINDGDKALMNLIEKVKKKVKT